MKNFKFNILTILMIIGCASTAIAKNQTAEKAHRPIKKNHHSKQSEQTSRAPRITKFIPCADFGGNDARGEYIRREQTATITNGDTIYFFHKIVRNVNPSIPSRKNLPENLVEIGSFVSYRPGKPEMPITTYLFGCLTDGAESQETTENESSRRKPMGSSKATWAPITFQPSKQFSGDGLVGNYFSSTQVATIHDPSGQNRETYTFKNVDQGGIQAPEGLILIGSYLPKPNCNGNICSHAMRTINLYGQLTDNQN